MTNIALFGNGALARDNGDEISSVSSPAALCHVARHAQMNLRRLVFVAVLAATSLGAAEITGIVREVSGDTASVLVEGELVPGIGDKADIYFKLPGVADEISVATGTVTAEEAGTVKVKIHKATGEVAREQLARFFSESPKAKSAKLPEQTESPAVAATETGPGPSRSEASRYFIEGLRKFDARDWQGAMADFTKALELDPTDAKAHANRAAVYIEWKQPERALAEVNEAIKLNPNISTAHVIRGNCYADLHQLKRALEDYDEALRLDPKNALAHNSRGIVHGQLGQTKIAIEDFSQAIAVEPTFVDAYANRALCYKAVGKTQLAKRDLAKVRELKAEATLSSSPKPAPAPTGEDE